MSELADPEPVKALGVDYGSKRIGLAVSDLMGWVAEPLEVIRRTAVEEDIARIRGVIERLEIQRVVVGVPNRMDGTEGPEAKRALAFAAELAAALPGVPVTTIDEALSTWEAQKMLEARGVKPKDRKRLLDAYAAAVILQEDLDVRRQKHDEAKS